MNSTSHHVDRGPSGLRARGKEGQERVEPVKAPGGVQAVAFERLITELRMERHRRRISQAELEHRLGWATGQLSRLERLGQVPMGSTLLEWMAALRFEIVRPVSN